MVRAYRQGTTDPIPESPAPVLPDVLAIIDSPAEGMTVEQRVAEVKAGKERCTQQLSSEPIAAQMLKRQIALWHENLQHSERFESVPTPSPVSISQWRMFHDLQKCAGIVSVHLPEGVENFSISKGQQPPRQLLERIVEAGPVAQQAYQNVLNVHACLYGVSDVVQSSDTQSAAGAVKQGVPISTDNFDGIFSYLAEYLLGRPGAYQTLFFIHFYETRGWRVSQTKEHIDNGLYYLFKKNPEALHRFLKWLSTSSYSAQIPTIVAQPLVKAALAVHAEVLLAKTPVSSYMDVPAVFDALADAHHAKMYSTAYVISALHALMTNEHTISSFCRDNQAALLEFVTTQDGVMLSDNKPWLVELLRTFSIRSFFDFCLHKATVWQKVFGITANTVKEGTVESAVEDGATAEDRGITVLFSLRGDAVQADVQEMIRHLKSLSLKDFEVFCKTYQKLLFALFTTFDHFYQLFSALVESVNNSQLLLTRRSAAYLPSDAKRVLSTPEKAEKPEDAKAERASNQAKFDLLTALFCQRIFFIKETDNDHIIALLIYLPLDPFKKFIAYHSAEMQRLFSSPVYFHKLCDAIFDDKGKLECFVKKTFRFQNIILFTSQSPEEDVHRVLSFLPSDGIEDFCARNQEKLCKFYSNSDEVLTLLNRKGEPKYVMYILDAINYRNMPNDSRFLPRLFRDLSVSQFSSFVTKSSVDWLSSDAINAFTSLDVTKPADVEKRRKFFLSIIPLDDPQSNPNSPKPNSQQIINLVNLLPKDVCDDFFSFYKGKLLDFISFEYYGTRSTLTVPTTGDSPGLMALKKLLVQDLTSKLKCDSWAKPYSILSFAKPEVPPLVSKLRELMLRSDSLSFHTLCQELAAHCNPEKLGHWHYADICLALESCQPKCPGSQNQGVLYTSTARRTPVLVQA